MTTLIEAETTAETFDGHSIQLGTRDILGTTWFTVYIASRQAQAYGRRSLSGIYYRYATEAERAAYIERWKNERREKMAAKAAALEAKRAARNAFVNPYKVGDILHSSWGYDQTNVEFFQVLEVGPRSLKIVEVESRVKETGFMCGDCEAVPNTRAKHGGEAKWVTIQISTYGGEVSHSVPSPIHGNLYPGAKSHCSWYG